MSNFIERVITLSDANTGGSAGLEVHTRPDNEIAFRVLAREGQGVYRACETVVYPEQVQFLIEELQKLLAARKDK